MTGRIVDRAERIWLCSILEEPAGVVHWGVGRTKPIALAQALDQFPAHERILMQGRIERGAAGITYQRRELR